MPVRLGQVDNLCLQPNDWATVRQICTDADDAPAGAPVPALLSKTTAIKNNDVDDDGDL